MKPLFKKILITLPIVAITATVTSLAVVTFSTKDATPSMKIERVNLSTKAGSENLIEVFTDGFDYDWQVENIKNDPLYKDFYLFDKFITNGAPTKNGRITEFGGFSKYNTFEIQRKHPNENFNDAVFHNEMVNAMKDHFNQSGSSFSQNNIYGVYDTWANGAAESDAQFLKDSLPGINIGTWTGNKETLAGKWGINSFSPDTTSFEAFSKVLNISNNSKGGRVLIQDMQTHSTRMTNEAGNFELGVSKSDSNKGLINTMSRTFNKLKNFKDTNGNLYDNSMIIIWGDHSAHEKPANTLEDRINHAHSSLLIKFPHETKNGLNIVSDKLVTGPQINRIIRDQFDKHLGINMFNNPSYEVNRNLYFNWFIKIYSATKWDTAQNKLIHDTSRNDIDFDINRDSSTLNQMFSDMLGGEYE